MVDCAVAVDPKHKAGASGHGSTWTGGRVRRDKAEQADRQFWQSASGGVRLQATWELAWEWYGDEAEAAGGLRRAPHGVRRR